MQTFLPSPDMRQAVEFLDDKRLGKQRVETKQILIALGIDVGEHEGNLESRWRNHPATKMWKGYEGSLAQYGWFCCREWVGRGFKDSLTDQFAQVMLSMTDECDIVDGVPTFPIPCWLGDQRVHRSHRSNLLRKDYQYYCGFFTERDDIPYFWPV